MASEIALAYQWINATLRADTALMAASPSGRVWQGAADIGTQPPFVIYARQSDIDVLTMAAVRLWSNLLIQIKAVGPVASFDTLTMMANRIDALFKDVRNVALPSGGGILSSYREQQLELPEEVAPGVMWSHIGGLYRVALQGQ